MSGGRHSAAFQVVAIVGSQGALPVARQVLAGLSADFPAAVVYVQHRLAEAGSRLAELLGYHTCLPVREASDGDPVLGGAIHVARADAETTIAADGTFRVTDGRCLGDPLLASVAAAYGPAAVAVVLSGRLRDGAAGLRHIKLAGGRGLVQAPATAEADGMPLSALATGCYDFVLPPAGLHAALVALVTVPGAADLLGVRTHPDAAVGAVGI